jgi:hypothetical protein
LAAKGSRRTCSAWELFSENQNEEIWVKTDEGNEYLTRGKHIVQDYSKAKTEQKQKGRVGKHPFEATKPVEGCNFGSFSQCLKWIALKLSLFSLKIRFQEKIMILKRWKFKKKRPIFSVWDSQQKPFAFRLVKFQRYFNRRPKKYGYKVYTNFGDCDDEKPQGESEDVLKKR